MTTETKEVKKKAAPKTTRAKKTKEAEGAAEATVTVASGAYIFALGRRKTSIARVRLITSGSGVISVNGKPMESYFGTFEQRNTVTSPLKNAGQETAVDVSANVEGGGLHSQAEAVRLGISRALTELNPTYRKTLKKLGFLTRDPRSKERKKPGLKKARRAPQWSKR